MRTLTVLLGFCVMVLSPLIPGTVSGATPEMEPNDTCPGQSIACSDEIWPATFANGTDEDWYAFTASAGTLLTIGTADGGGSSYLDTRIYLYRSDCNTLLTSDDNNGFMYFSLISQFTAPYTGTYHVQVVSAFQIGTYRLFLICGPPPSGACCLRTGACVALTRPQCETQDGQYLGPGTLCSPNPCPPIPVNDVCSDAIALPDCASGSLAGNTRTAQGDYSPGTCTSTPAWGRDVVYRLEMEPGEILDLTYVQTEADGSVYLMTDCAHPDISCVVGSDVPGIGLPETIRYTAVLPIGACCFYGGSCQILDQEACTQAGGQYQGHATACEPNLCPVPHGACCFHSGTCKLLTAEQCTDAGGQYEGDDTWCGYWVCTRPPGACCLAPGQCVFVDGETCYVQGGLFLGADVPCIPDPCAASLGACCLPDSSCVAEEVEACAQQGGTYQGDYVSCVSNPCPAQLGACCFADGRCLLLSRDVCEAYGAYYLDYPSCNPNPCPCAQPKWTPLVYYLVLDSRGLGSGGPWTLSYSVACPAGATESNGGSGAIRLEVTPNPTSGETRLIYRIPVGSACRLEVFDAAGRLVRRLAAPASTGSEGEIRWDGRNGSGLPVRAGVYFARLTAGGVVQAGRIVVIE